MKKFKEYIQKIFNKNRVVDLFPSKESTNVAELGGNYCSDVC